MLDRFFHHLGTLQHEGKNELARAELVADLFHGRQQDFVKNLNRILTNSGVVQLLFNPFLFTMQDHPVNPFSRSHPRRRIDLLGAPGVLGG